MTRLLAGITSPRELKKLSLPDLMSLSGEVRGRLMEVVNVNGGHLASNLGVVELTLALHYSFDFLEDRLVWDVSHQTYGHKILTSRNELFARLRQYQGCCGFASKQESRYDLFDAGHAGTSVSAGLGIAVGERTQQRSSRTVVVIGDASLAAGMPFEAMNHAGDLGQNLLVILNDNSMSIDVSVGALSKYLNKIRTAAVYRGLKRDIQVMLPRIPLVGKPLEEGLEQLHHVVHHALVPGQIFEELGFRYFGPLDGHDLPGLVENLSKLRTMTGPVLLHLLTNKGHGFGPAQKDPIKYHASKDFLPSKEPPQVKPVHSLVKRTFSDVFREVMVRLGEEDPKVCGITAAMPGGTGMAAFQERFPERYFDVGIAEQHGTCFSSGLAFSGLKPVFAVYSTFLQRGYDQVIHDVCLQGNHVVFALDRAGLVEDGPTHHGLYDIAYLRTVPGITLAAPADGEELEAMLRLALQHDTPVALRYPKCPIPQLPRQQARQPLEWGKAELLREPQEITVLAYGSMVEVALQVADGLAEEGRPVGVVNMRFAKPLDSDMVCSLEDPLRTLVTLEEHAVHGGFGSAVLEEVHAQGLQFAGVHLWGVPDRFVSFGPRHLLLKELCLDSAGVNMRICALRTAPSHRLRSKSGVKL
ncbi:MAG: 1-deoxy-D-xylulose-5-phosphate synthase [Planctomycetota bacterium]